MKRIRLLSVLLGLLVLSLSAVARPRPWGEDAAEGEYRKDKQNHQQVREANEQSSRRAEEQNAKRGPNSPIIKPMLVEIPGEEYDPPLYRIIKGQTLQVYIWKSPTNKRRDYDRKVVGAFDSWFSHARVYIGKREKEFADIMPVLQRGVMLDIRYVSGEKTLPANSVGLNVFDSKAEMQKQCECTDCEACKSNDSPHSRVLYMYKNDPEFQTSLEHELGHLLGLGDEYGKRDFSSNSSRRRPTRKKGYSLMDGQTPDMQCDDADGLINLIDLWNNCRSERAKNGWESLCGDGTMYRCGNDAFYSSSTSARHR